MSYRDSARADDGGLHDRVLVRTEGLGKRFGRETALDGVTFELERGRTTAILGAEGAGKTTLMRSIAGLVVPSRGTVETFGVEARDLDGPRLARLGHVDEDPGLIPWMRVDAHVGFVASHHDPGRWVRRRVEGLLEGLEIPFPSRVGSLPPDKRYGLGFALAVGHAPDLLLVDTPPVALGPGDRGLVHDTLRALARDARRAIVVCCRHAAELPSFVDDVLLVDRGRLVARRPLVEVDARGPDPSVVGPGWEETG